MGATAWQLADFMLGLRAALNSIVWRHSSSNSCYVYVTSYPFLSLSTLSLPLRVLLLQAVTRRCKSLRAGRAAAPAVPRPPSRRNLCDEKSPNSLKALLLHFLRVSLSISISLLFLHSLPQAVVHRWRCSCGPIWMSFIIEWMISNLIQWTCRTLCLLPHPTLLLYPLHTFRQNSTNQKKFWGKTEYENWC